MKFRTRARPTPALPGVSGTARVERDASTNRFRAGEIAIVSHVDMDRGTAQSLIDSGVVAVVNTQRMISGRYPNLGPQHLVEAGIPVVDEVDAAVLSKVRTGARVRLDGDRLHLGEDQSWTGRVVDGEVVAADMDAARSGLTTQLLSFTHNSTEFLRREQDLLLHGHGIPELPEDFAGRPAVVVVAAHDHRSELRGLKPYLKENRPVVLAVDKAADSLQEVGRRPDVIVLTAAIENLPSAEVLRKAARVVLLCQPGASRSVSEPLERMGCAPIRFETTATAEDAALLLADATGASLIVGVGMHATLDEFLDRNRPGLASTYLTRLKLGPRLVDASAVPALYDGAVRPRHLVAVSIFGAALLAVAVGVTPVGQEWAGGLGAVASDIYDYVRGLFA